jgi:hypothetical protein
MLPILIHIGKNQKYSNAKPASFVHAEIPLTRDQASTWLGIRPCPAQDSNATGTYP